jgi:hypothetical protein
MFAAQAALQSALSIHFSTIEHKKHSRTIWTRLEIRAGHSGSERDLARRLPIVSPTQIR